MILFGKEVADWVFEKAGGGGSINARGLAWQNSKGVITGAFALTGYNHYNAIVSQRHDEPSPRILWQSFFRWCFDQLGCKRLTAMVACYNKRALLLNEKMGAKYEAVLTGAADDGGDLVIMVMRREDCNILKWRGGDLAKTMDNKRLAQEK